MGGGHAAYLPVCAVIAVLTSALTLATFIKFFGVSFLSRRSDPVSGCAATRGRIEVGWMMQLPQMFFALCCVALGVVPSVAFRLLQRALDTSRDGYGGALADAASLGGGPAWGVGAIGFTARYAPLALAFFLALLLFATRAIARMGNAPRRTSPIWMCGYAQEAECHRYAAVHFYGELKRYFGWINGRPTAQPRPATPKQP
jgi:NADH:ubiquinone oxidoreductase subunit 5 (subunit L)/multisubunit Na+/H+ antiporter MnhA subunit